MATSGNYTWTPSSYGPGVGYPNRAKISWSASWNQSSMLWTVNWNATAQGGANAARWTTVFGSNNNCNSYVTVTDENGNTLQTKTIVARMDTVKNDAVLLEGTFTVGVDTNGNRSLTFGGQINFETTGAAGISSGSQTFALDNIPLASTISSVSPSNVAVTTSGGAVTVNIARNNNAYRHTVVWSFGSHSTTQTGQGTSASYTIPASWLDAIPSSKSGTGTVTVTTYDGSTQIGTAKSANFTVTASVSPSITTVSVAPRGAAYNAGMTSVYISGYSTAYISASGVSAGTGATISKYEFIRDGQVLATFNSSATSYNYTTGTLSGSSATFSVRVTDSRGVQATKAASAVSIAAYATPAFSNTSVYRSNSSGTADGSGTYIYLKTTATATPGANSITTLTYATKQTSASAYGAETSLTSGTAKIASGFANTSSYNIRITATDKLGNKSYYYATIPTQTYTMDFKVGGDGVAFGKVAETANLVDSAWSIKSAGLITAQDGMRSGRSANPYLALEAPSGTEWANIQHVTGTTAGVQRADYTRFAVNSYNGSTGARLSYTESYNLPQVDANRTASAAYKILTTKQWIAAATYTVNSGYFVITNSKITASSGVIIQDHYSSSIGASKWTYTVQPLNGSANVYVRDGNGNLPSNGTNVYVAALII